VGQGGGIRNVLVTFGTWSKYANFVFFSYFFGGFSHVVDTCCKFLLVVEC
jgi:hypothetical protein